jgi:hypothetical protein
MRWPAWAKVALAAALVLIVVMGVRYFPALAAYLAASQAQRAAANQDFDTAARRMRAAAKWVPGHPQYLSSSKYFQALALVQDDRMSEALAVLQELLEWTPNDAGVKTLALQAEMGVALEQREFDRMLRSAQDLSALNPGHPLSLLSEASAYASRYASSGDEAALGKARELLAEAAVLDPAGDLNDYRNRIEHRLATGELMRRKEFERRFPQGWKPDSPVDNSPK